MYRERRKTTTTQQQQQQQGINWGLIAGGAVATVLSVAFSRSKKKQASSGNGCSSISKNSAPVSLDSDAASLRRESSSGSSSSKSEASEGDESFSVFNRSAVHKLRHQLKSRDQMIMQMQSQLSDKERALYSHKSLISKLEKQVEDANESIFEVERVIHELGDSPTPSAAAPIPREVVKTADVVFVEEEDDRSLVLHAKEGEYGLVFEKAKHLEAELVGIRAMAQEMSSLLELSEQERLRLHHVVSQLQHKLAFQAKELGTLRATTHFLKLSLGSTRRSGNDVDVHSRLSKDDADGLIQLNSSMSVFSNPQERYAASDKLMEVADIDSSVREDNLTSSSASSFPDLSDGADWADEQIAEFRTEESPGVVRMGSPTIAGSRSVDNPGLAAARRYLFVTAAGTEDEEEEEETLEAVVEEEPKEAASSSSSASSVTDEKMLDDTLDDLVRATTTSSFQPDADD